MTTYRYSDPTIPLCSIQLSTAVNDVCHTPCHAVYNCLGLWARNATSVDLSTKAGPQHYAILQLLTTYGLRAGEIAQLRLDNIDWRKETIHIAPGKTGKDLWLPLTAGVGKAILRYLKDRRPPSKYREIFLLTCAPWTPLKSGNIGYVVNRHIKLAGLNLPRGGPHLLRHSFATRLVRAGASLKEIGDLLGHRDPESTHTYTKTATERLREVALEMPEIDHAE